jgi:PKD repeat protein
MTTYYVHKGVGSDSNNGLSWANCFNSLKKARDVSGNNDTIYVRAGSTPYYETLELRKNGQRWLADDGHQPVVDGKYHDNLSTFALRNIPEGTYVVMKSGKNQVPALCPVGGDDNELGGFKICNSAGHLIVVSGARNHLHDLRVDFAYSGAMIITGGGDKNSCVDNLLEDIETSRGSIQRFADGDAEFYGSAQYAYIAVCNAMKNCKRNTFRRVRSHHQNGESLVLGKGSEDCVIEECTVWNNYHMNIYLNNTKRPTVRWTTSWTTWNDEYLRGSDNPGPTETLVFGDEAEGQDDVGEFSQGQQVYGNLFVGGATTFGIRVGKNYNTRLRDAYIGYNTFVGIAGVTDWMITGGQATASSHSNTIIENNVFYAPSQLLKNAFIKDAGMSGLKGRNNVFFWKGHNLSLPGWLSEGAIIADPKLVDPEFVVVDNGGNGNVSNGGQPVDGGNNFNKNKYLLTGSSPAIGAAAGGYPFFSNPGVPLAAQRDHFGAPRNDPDCGFHEFGGTVTNSVTAAFSRNPSGTTLVEGTQVTFTDTSYATGSASITGRTWTVKKGGTTVHTATSTNLSYTFATDGSYTVELAVTATGGLSDNEIISYTITNDAPGVVVTAAFSANPSQTTVQQGTVVTFTGQSTVQNGTLASQAWAVLELPGGTVVVASGTGGTFQHTFNTPGSFRVRLTATAATGESDTETRDYTVTAVTTPTVDAAFTSSDVDNIIREGESITFTNTSTVANTTLSGYLWTVERLGGGGQASYTTANITHVFASPGIYTVTLRADTAAGVSDAETMTITVQGQTTTGDDFLIVPHTFALATSTGAQTVTAAALGTKIPKGVHLKIVGATTAGTAAAGALLSEGAADGQAQWVHCRFAEDNATVANPWRRYSTAKIAMTIDAAGAKTGEAAFVKFVAGGMELNVSDAFPAGYLAEATFYAGDGCEFWAGTVGGIGAAGQTRTVETGIDQDAVYLCSTWAAVEDVAEAHADISRGWAVRSGTQYHIRNRDIDAADPAALVSRLQPRIGSSADGVPGYCSIEAGNFTAGSFTLLPYSSAMNRAVSMFAFRAGGHGVWLGMVALPTSGALDVALPFEAQTAQAITSSYGVTPDPVGQLGGANAEAIGWHTTSVHGPLSFSGGIASADGASPTNTHSLGATGFRQVSAAGGDLWNGTAALEADSFNVTWTGQPGYGYRLVLLAVEKGTEVVDPGDAPTADFTVTTEVDPAGGRLLASFDASISNGNGEEITAYAWAFGDGTTGSGATVTHLYELAGEFTVTLTVTTAAGSDTKSVTLTVPAAPPLQAPILVGPIDPATSGGDTPNAIDDETASHTHEIAGKWLKFKPLTDDEFWDFQFSEPDPDHVLLAFWSDRFVVKRLDGVIRYIYPTTLPPPGSEGA